MAGWITGAAWGGLVAVAAGASFAEPPGFPARTTTHRGSVWIRLDLSEAPPGSVVPAQGAHVYIDVHPDTAGVSLDGQEVGRAHGFVAAPLRVPPGVHRLDVALAGFKALSMVVDVSGQQAYVLRATLQPDDSEEVDEPGSGYVIVLRR